MLRHKQHLGALEALDRSVESREVLPLFRAPVKVEFRRGADLGSVVDAVKKNRCVELGAAVGSGKSTKCPMSLAKAMGRLVIHTIPFHVSARYLAEYLIGTEYGDHVVYVDDLETDMPSHGVALMSNAHFHARWGKNKFSDANGAILYLDEVHESDCFTAVLRRTAPAISAFSAIILATATSAPGVKMSPDLPGQRVDRTYPKTAVATWSASDKGQPWSADRINANTMLCIDRETTRMRLASEYRHQGFDVRVHTSNTDYEYFRESVRRLADPSGGIVIMLVDYAYRSSLTIPGLCRLIDSCEVGVPDVDRGMPVWRYRPAYDFEVQQFLGRGGRLSGERVELFRSAEPSPKAMCDLECLEADAANLLYRMMGFRPPLNLESFAFFEGDVPIDLAAAMSSQHPLKLCPSESRVPWVNGDQGLRYEKANEEEFRYQMGERGRKYASCHTVMDMDRVCTPPPPVPRHHLVTKVDVDGLDDYRSSREASPSPTVYTIHSDERDNLSLFEDPDNLPFVKPKRVAKRVLEERAAAAAEEERRVQQQGGLALGPSIVEVPDFPAVVERSGGSATTVGLTGGVSVRRMDSAVSAARHVQGTIRDRDKGDAGFRIGDDDLGTYVYYHGMDKAASTSNYFLRGYESLVRFCERRDALMHAPALPDDEKLYAMKLLVEKFNSSTAVAMGIQRLFTEVRGRPSAELQSLVDHDEMLKTLEWMADQCAQAQLRVRMCRDFMPYFMRYELDKIPPALELEQRVMIEMMEKFDSAAVKKDPDKIGDYLRGLNGRGIRVGPTRAISGRHKLSIE